MLEFLVKLFFEEAFLLGVARFIAKVAMFLAFGVALGLIFGGVGLAFFRVMSVGVAVFAPLFLYGIDFSGWLA